MADPKVNLFGPSTEDDIKVGYISTTRGYITGVGIRDANTYAKKDPGTKFILQNRDYIKYLNINQVNALTPEVLKATAIFTFDRYSAGKFSSYDRYRGSYNNRKENEPKSEPNNTGLFGAEIIDTSDLNVSFTPDSSGSGSADSGYFSVN